MKYLILLGLLTTQLTFANSKSKSRRLYFSGKGAYPNNVQLTEFHKRYTAAEDKRKFLIESIVQSREFFYGTCQLMFAHFFSEETIDEALKQASTINGDGSLSICRAVLDSDKIKFHDIFTEPYFYKMGPGNFGETIVTTDIGEYDIVFKDYHTQQDRAESCKFYNPGNAEHHNCISKHMLDPQVLVRTPQISNTHERYADELVGILTTNQWADEWLRDGTNRSALAYGVFERLLGKTMNDLFDISTPNTFVRYDVDRSDPLEYSNKCIGCHSGMDPLLSAFAYHDSSGSSLKIREHARPDPANPNNEIYYGPVHFKYFDERKMQEPTAIPVTSNSWENLWCSGKNAEIFNKGECKGVGLRSFMKSMVMSPEFGKQMARTAYRGVCGLKAENIPQDFVEISGKNFGDSGNFMILVADALIACHDRDQYQSLTKE